MSRKHRREHERRARSARGGSNEGELKVLGLKPAVWWRGGAAVLAIAMVAALTANHRGAQRKAREEALKDVEVWLREGQNALSGNRPQVAADKLDQVLNVLPDRHEARLLRGQAARMLGNTDEAFAHWNQLAGASPDERATGKLLEGTLHIELGRTRLAEQAWLASLELSPDRLAVRDRLAGLYRFQGRGDELRAQLTASARLRSWRPLDLVEYRLAWEPPEDLDKTIAMLENWVSQDAADSASRRGLVRALWFASDTDRVERVIREAPGKVQQDPVLREIGFAILVSRQPAFALSRFAEVWPKPVEGNLSAMWWRTLGRAASGSGEFALAASAWEEAERLAPDYPGIAHQRGTALVRAGSHRAAEACFSRARKIERANTVARRLGSGDLRRTDLAAPLVEEIVAALVSLERFEEAGWWAELALTWRPDSMSARELVRLAATGLSRANAGKPPTVAPSLPPPDLSKYRHTPPPVPTTASDATMPPAIQLVDEAQARGLSYQFDPGLDSAALLLQSVGGGVSVLDYDRDGRPDFFFPQGGSTSNGTIHPSPNSRHALYRQANHRFVDIAELAGFVPTAYGQGAAAGDWDNDGFVDLVVATLGGLLWYRNHGDGTFAEVSPLRTGAVWTTSVGWGDFDGDGDLDLFEVNYLRDPDRVCRDPQGRPRVCHPGNHDPEPDRFYENLGDGRFEDATGQAGIRDTTGKGLGLVIADFDDDARIDLFVANDGTPNHLYRNRTDTPDEGARSEWRFEEIGVASGSALAHDGRARAGMGIACADLDRDGRLDLFVTNFYDESNALFLQREPWLFNDDADRAGLAASSRNQLGFGTQAIDFNLDGLSDLLVANGHIGDFTDQGLPWKMRPQLFAGRSDATFAEVTDSAGAYFSRRMLGRGVGACDWNRDGLPDAVVVHQDCPVSLLTNRSPAPGHSLAIELIPTRSNRSAIGTRIVAKAQGRDGQPRRLRTDRLGGDGFLATNDDRLILGLGDATEAELQIRWPSGVTQTLPGVAAGKPLRIREP